ncbi:hypothetical protein [Nostoc sp. WHI]|uniref:hypothetical protein n=1 Tax=Nostoc sp. WHI TaxID=2650611 RepID=UPI0018C514B4|nr:hypothetical protein [Nostoc sp. WHI]MBG1265509.1 hypothetical protein [Nostoc sp. WHI]
MAKLNIGSIDLSDFDKDWFLVVSRLMERSVRANLASVTSFYIRRNIGAFRELLAYTAKKHGITEEECFQILLSPKGELPPAVDGFEDPQPDINEDE